MKRNIAAGWMAGTRPVRRKYFEVHQSGDGEPAFGAGRPRHLEADAATLVEAHPQVELNSEPGVEQDEGDLDRVA